MVSWGWQIPKAAGALGDGGAEAGKPRALALVDQTASCLKVRKRPGGRCCVGCPSLWGCHHPQAGLGVLQWNSGRLNTTPLRLSRISFFEMTKLRARAPNRASSLLSESHMTQVGPRHVELGVCCLCVS